MDIDITTRLPFVCDNAYGSATRVSPEACLASNGTHGDGDAQIEAALDALEQRIHRIKLDARYAQYGF